MDRIGRLVEAVLSLVREVDAMLAAPSVENARRAAEAERSRAAARRALEDELGRFLAREELQTTAHQG